MKYIATSDMLTPLIERRFPHSVYLWTRFSSRATVNWCLAEYGPDAVTQLSEPECDPFPWRYSYIGGRRWTRWNNRFFFTAEEELCKFNATWWEEDPDEEPDAPHALERLRTYRVLVIKCPFCEKLGSSNGIRVHMGRCHPNEKMREGIREDDL